MSESDDRQGPIERPKKFSKNRVARRVAKAAAGSVPYAGPALTEIVEASMPDHEARDRERWEGDVTDGVNHLHGRVDDIDARTGRRAVTFSGAAADIATYMIKRCPDGLAQDHVSRDELVKQFSEYSRDELLDGLGDLESYALIDIMEFANDEAIYRLTESAYEALDPPIMGWNTVEDARKVAALAVKNRDYVLTYDLEKELSWPRRRFNPAHRLIVQFVHPAHVSDELQPHYVTPQFNPSTGELAQLRRFAAGG